MYYIKEEAAIEHKGLFLNADAGFDSKSLREFLESKEIIANIKPNPRNGEQPDVYFDEELYKNRFKIEQANGWLDGYKGLIMRYEYLDVTWMGMLLLGFISKFLKKV
ncbi:transposase [Capnocytophaga gingivalis]|uniref:transposase n=1 Tax=Capnocytophaga gingivalis TaxID=1017 RepID=UPI003C756FBB